MYRIFAVLLMLFPATTAMARPAAPGLAQPASLTLQVRELPGLRLEVIVRNDSASAIHWIRPPGNEPGRFAQWGGWRVRMTGAGADWQPSALPGAVPPVDVTHCVVLPPGASERMEWSLANWIAQDPPEKKASVLAHTPGKFVVEVSYQPPARVVVGLDRVLEAGREISPLQESRARLVLQR